MLDFYLSIFFIFDFFRKFSLCDLDNDRLPQLMEVTQKTVWQYVITNLLGDIKKLPVGCVSLNIIYLGVAPFSLKQNNDQRTNNKRQCLLFSANFLYKALTVLVLWTRKCNVILVWCKECVIVLKNFHGIQCVNA